jgi:hypothetical protein
MLRKLTAFLVLALAPFVASAHMLLAPCDFITGGGFIFTDDGDMVNFAIQGGCKNGKWWGGINLVDHNTGLHFKSREITGYMMDPSDPNAREICGTGTINDDDKTVVYFRARVVDNGEPGKNDLFGIGFDNRTTSGERFMYISARKLANGEGGGGNVQLHKTNPSTTADPGFFQLEEWQMCGDLNSPQ